METVRDHLNKKFLVKPALESCPDIFEIVTGLEQASSQLKEHPLTLQNQPFDSLMLHISPLYRKSRQLYLDQGGQFLSEVSSKYREIYSPLLIEPIVQFSPVGNELRASALNPKRVPFQPVLMNYITHVYHEQNHRNFWPLFPRPPKNVTALFAYLAFGEGLAFALEYALACELGKVLASALYKAKVVYANFEQMPGKFVRQKCRPEYLTLLAYCYCLRLCQVPEEQLVRTVVGLRPPTKALAQRALLESQFMDPNFVNQTVVTWFRENYRHVQVRLKTGTGVFPETDEVTCARVRKLWFATADRCWLAYGIS